MSEATYWWPSKDQPGTYTIEHHSGAVWRDACWNGVLWSNGHKAVEPLEVLAWGYLGVRRETPAKQDLTALVREAIDDFRRNVKQPTKAADWAFKWANRFIEAVGS